MGAKMAQHTLFYRLLQEVTPQSVRVCAYLPGHRVARTLRLSDSWARATRSVDALTAGGLCRPNSGDWYSSRDVSDPGLQPRGSFRPRPRGVAHVPAVDADGAADPSRVLSTKSQSCL
jgi:hypothetical protein